MRVTANAAGVGERLAMCAIQWSAPWCHCKGIPATARGHRETCRGHCVTFIHTASQNPFIFFPVKFELKPAENCRFYRVRVVYAHAEQLKERKEIFAKWPSWQLYTFPLANDTYVNPLHTKRWLRTVSVIQVPAWLVTMETMTYRPKKWIMGGIGVSLCYR